TNDFKLKIDFASYCLHVFFFNSKVKDPTHWLFAFICSVFKGLLCRLATTLISYSSFNSLSRTFLNIF
ncbi:hypothetical protein, partial [uncultured Enterococcus sp.]|uniref:hypothetical protein n=1 Tax=uncultured Enterococcus sp. TaxID=167972 RepID=UPI002630923B